MLFGSNTSAFLSGMLCLWFWLCGPVFEQKWWSPIVFVCVCDSLAVLFENILLVTPDYKCCCVVWDPWAGVMDLTYHYLQTTDRMLNKQACACAVLGSLCGEKVDTSADCHFVIRTLVVWQRYIGAWQPKRHNTKCHHALYSPRHKFQSYTMRSELTLWRV